MLARATTIQRASAVKPALTEVFGQVRGMATEKQIFEKMTSTKGIAKITSSMRMVAAAKLKQDEKRLAAGKDFANWTKAMFGGPVYVDDSPTVDISVLGEKTLILAVTSDKGLCGGVNNYVSKAVKATAAELDTAGKDYSIVVVGDKGRSGLQTAQGHNILTSINESWGSGTNFAQVSAIATEVTANDYDNLVIFYNEFKSVIAYNTSFQVLPRMTYEGSADSIEEGSIAEKLMAYDVEPEDRTEAIESLNQFTTAVAMTSAFLEQATSFQSSQMSAMENATQNANEVVAALTIQYNRARQSRITTELIEIISGASALDG